MWPQGVDQEGHPDPEDQPEDERQDLPMPLTRVMARCVYGWWDIHPTAYIGPSVLTVDHVSMGPGASIGGRNTITNVQELRLGEGAPSAPET